MLSISASIVLADHADAANGKAYINGGGWNSRPAHPIPWAIALFVQAPWSELNRKFPFRLELLDADGQQFFVDDPGGQQPVAADGEFILGAGPLAKPGSRLNGFAPIVLPPISLPPGESFEWKLSIKGETRDEWSAPFSVLAAPAAPGEVKAA